MTHPCETKMLVSQPTLFIRATSPVQELPAIIGQCYARIAAYAAKVGVQMACAPYIAYYNMDMQALDVEIGFPLTAAVPGEGEIQAGTLPDTKVAACFYTGPYSKLQDGYNTLMKYLEDNQLEAGLPWYEFYLNDPAEVPEEKLETEIMAPLS